MAHINSNRAGDKKNLNWDLLPPKPVKANIAFSLYRKDAERDNLSTESNNLIRSIEDQWNGLPDGDRHTYNSQASKLYVVELDAWQTKKDKLKRPPGAFTLFMLDIWNEEKSKGKRLMLGEISRKAKSAWNRASRLRKSEYKTKAREMLIQYNAFYDGFRQGKINGRPLDNTGDNP